MANCKTKNTKEHYRMLMYNLRALRRSKKISVQELAEYLSGCGIYNDTKTIYGWENGVGTPSLDTVLLMCRLYGVTDIFEIAGMTAFPREGEAVWVSEEEKDILEAYRSRPQMQESVRRLLIDPMEEA